jgi:hypothetical protein
MAGVWRKCAVCKKDIMLGSIYQKCSVSTCRKSAYCSVDCWDVHVPVLGHKSAWAEEERAPTSVDGSDHDQDRAPRRILVSSQGDPSNSIKEEIPEDILIVASKLKQYVKTKYDLSTSAGVFDRLSDIVRQVTDEACRKAKSEGRKTLMDRDY